MTNPLPIDGNIGCSRSAPTTTVATSSPAPATTTTAARSRFPARRRLRAKIKTTVKVSPRRAKRGKKVRISPAVKSDRAEKLAVKVSIYRGGRRALRRKLTIKTASGKTRKGSFTWRVPSKAATGRYTVRFEAASKAGKAASKKKAASFRVR